MSQMSLCRRILARFLDIQAGASHTTRISKYKPKIGLAFLPGTAKARLFGDTMKFIGLVCLSVLSLSSASHAFDAFPLAPDPSLTPGSLCSDPSEFRYAENIPYCNRKVSGSEKSTVIVTYDKALGFEVLKMKREDFKVDHYIPLCMGGSNQPDNLWPQHKSVYEITDPLEGEACNRMAEGKLRQKEAIELMKRAKADLTEAPKVIEYVQDL